MPSINDRIGSQNVIRVLANAAAPPTRLLNLNDVNSTLKTRDGMILVWDTTTEKFYLTDAIDSGTITISGIATFSNTTTSTAPTNGALIVSGGAGIGKQVNLGDNLSVAGISTFASNLDINAAVDILNGLKVNGSFETVGVTTLASGGNLTKTGGNFEVVGVTTTTSLIVNQNATISKDLLVSRNAKIVGILTVGSDSITITDSNISGIDQASLSNLNVSGATTTGSLNVTSDVQFAGNVTIGGTLTYDDVTNVDSVGLITARSGIRVGQAPNWGAILSKEGDVYNVRYLNIVGVSTFTGISTFVNDLFVGGTLSAGLIDGGEF